MKIINKGNYSLDGRKALIIGSTGGIGCSIAHLFADEGAEVCLHYNHSFKAASEMARDIGGKVHLVQADVKNVDNIKDMYEKVKKNWDSFDLLIYCAGIHANNLYRNINETDWDSVMNVNLKGAFFCMKHAVSLLKKSKSASIVNITSIAAHRSTIYQSCYNASKAGLISLTKSMANELSVFNIRVNAVSPGPVETNMKPITLEEKQQLSKRFPLKRIAKPIDVASAVLYLSSPTSCYITGQEIIVDGGYTLL